MINSQVYQIVAEENSSSLLPAKTANCVYPAGRSWTPREIGWTGARRSFLKQQEYLWKHKKRVVEGLPTELVTAEYFHDVTFITRGCTIHANI